MNDKLAAQNDLEKTLRELKYQQTIESLTQQIAALEKKVPKPKRTTKDAGEIA